MISGFHDFNPVSEQNELLHSTLVFKLDITKCGGTSITPEGYSIPIEPANQSLRIHQKKKKPIRNPAALGTAYCFESHLAILRL